MHSLTLVQGATSLWGYCNANPPLTSNPGYFRGLVDQKKVAGPIVTTQSKRDTAVGRFYPIAAGIARQVNFAPGDTLPKYGGIGAFGLQGPGLTLHDLADRRHDARRTTSSAATSTTSSAPTSSRMAPARRARTATSPSRKSRTRCGSR